ncbi:MAG: ankyrin repeat domain-containing protein [Gammaproteobacteria bacterium]
MLFYKKQIICISLLAILSINIAHSIEPETKKNNLAYTANSQLSISIYDLLYSAIKMDSAFEVKKFIEFGADINHRYANGKTPLMMATSIGSIKCVKMLLELGADSSLKSNAEMTAMDYANKANEIVIINTLRASITSKPIDSPSVSKDTNDIIIAEDIPIIN